MFNLFRSSAKFTKYMLGGLLLIVAASMVTYLIPSTGLTTASSTGDNVLAEVGNSTITTDDAKAAANRLVQGGQLPKDAVEVYLPQLVDQLVQDRAATYAFQKLGLTVTDEEVLTGLMSIYPQFFKDGKLAAPDQLESALQSQQGLTLAGGVDMMRQQLLLRKVQNMAMASVVVTQSEVDQALIKKHQTAKIEYIAFPPAKFRDQVKPTPATLQQEFQRERGAYTVPEKRSFEVLVADQAKIAESMTVSDAQLRSAYAASMDSFRSPERVKARHILLMTQGKSDAEKKAALAKAQDLLKQARAGADFADLAKKNSQDPGSAQNGGELGFIVRGQTVPPFEKFVFSAKPNEISDLITTEYGYHIIQVEEKQPARVKPFEEVKDGIADQLKKQGVNEKMQATVDQARAALLKAPASAADVAKQFGLEIIPVKDAKTGDLIPSLGASPEINAALAGMKPNDVSDSLLIAGNKIAIVVLNQKTPPTAAQFSDVEAQVRDRYVTATSISLSNQAALKAAGMIHDGADLESVAKTMKLDVIRSADFTASDSIEGLGNATVLPEVFTKPVGSTNGPQNVEGRNIIYKILARSTPDPKLYSNERDSAVTELKQGKARTMYGLFQDSLLEQVRQDGKLKVHQAAIQQLAATYHQSR